MTRFHVSASSRWYLMFKSGLPAKFKGSSGGISIEKGKKGIAFLPPDRIV
jgi:hypothetical protein